MNRYIFYCARRSAAKPEDRCHALVSAMYANRAGTGMCCTYRCETLFQRLMETASPGRAQLQADEIEQRLSGSQFDDMHVWPHAQED